LNEDRFDALTRRLATDVSRRGVMKILGAGIVGGVLGVLGRGSAWAHEDPKPEKGNDTCAHICAALFPPGPERGACISAAAKGEGPCFNLCDATGGACGDVPFCGEGCACQPTAEGPGFCNNISSCADLVACEATSDCPPGWACSATCCPGLVCIPPCGTVAGAGVASTGRKSAGN